MPLMDRLQIKTKTLKKAIEKNRGFGLCFLYLCNVKGFKWNHKRVYRIYRDLYA